MSATVAIDLPDPMVEVENHGGTAAVCTSSAP
jgi:hypothetical protein